MYLVLLLTKLHNESPLNEEKCMLNVILELKIKQTYNNTKFDICGVLRMFEFNVTFNNFSIISRR